MGTVFFFPGISCCCYVFYEWKCTRHHSMYPQSPSCRGGKSHQYLKISTLISSPTSLFFHPNLQSPRPLALHSELFSPLVCPFPIWAIKEMSALLFLFFVNLFQFNANIMQLDCQGKYCIRKKVLHRKNMFFLC